MDVKQDILPLHSRAIAMNGPQGKLSIVKIEEFHTDTRFGKGKKGSFSKGVAHFKRVSSLEEFLGGLRVCRRPSTAILSRRFPFKCAQTRKTVIWAIGEKGIHVTAQFYRFCQHELISVINQQSSIPKWKGKNSRFLKHDTL